MRLDVFLTPGEVAPAELADRTVVVLDILRATSTIVQAMSAGAKAIYPVASIEDALRLANTLGREGVLLAGERKSLPIEGFDLGNSPLEFTHKKVAGKTLVMTTTNGTNVLALTAGASRVLIGSLLNLGAVVDDLVRTGADPVIVCAGRERHFALEDALCAGRIAARVMEARPGEWALNDGARAAVVLAGQMEPTEELFRQAAGGRAIVEAGLEGDLAYCAQIDLHDILPVLQDRNITLAPVAVG